MKQTLLSLSLLLVSLGAPTQPPAPQPAMVMPCRVEKVRDGDTIEVVVETRYAIRLRDVWCHELHDDDEGRRYKAVRSMDKLTQKCLGKRGVCEIPFVTKDGELLIGKSITFDRWVGDVVLEGEPKSLATWMVDEGWAAKTKKELE